MNGCDSITEVSSIYRFLSLLARTTSPTRLLSSHSPEIWHQETPLFDERDTSIEYIYGVVPELGNMLQSTCQLAESLNRHEAPQLPEELSKEYKSLRHDLRSWRLDPEQFASTVPDSIMSEILRCQARAFHNAVLIYFYRSTRQSRPINLDYEVDTILENLEHAENLKDGYQSGEKRTAPMSWPAFIAACEATDRRPWSHWWPRLQEYNMGNFVRQWNIIQEIWDLVDHDESVIDWLQALDKSKKIVLPI